MEAPMGKSITSNARLDKEFFSPPEPRGDKNFFVACPTIGFAVILSGSLLAYRMRMYSIWKAQGHNMQLFFYNTRFMVCGSFMGISILTVVAGLFAGRSSRAANNITEEDVRRSMFGDHKPRKLPNQQIKPITYNPMVLVKTNVLEQVLLKKFNANSQVD